LFDSARYQGKQISIFSPIVDGKLPDGSRLQATLARTVTKGSTFTIRKFREIPLTPIDLIEYKSMSTEMAAYFLDGNRRWRLDTLHAEGPLAERPQL